LILYVTVLNTKVYPTNTTTEELGMYLTLTPTLSVLSSKKKLDTEKSKKEFTLELNTSEDPTEEMLG